MAEFANKSGVFHAAGSWLQTAAMKALFHKGRSGGASLLFEPLKLLSEQDP